MIIKIISFSLSLRWTWFKQKEDREEFKDSRVFSLLQEKDKLRSLHQAWFPFKKQPSETWRHNLQMVRMLVANFLGDQVSGWRFLLGASPRDPSWERDFFVQGYGNVILKRNYPCDCVFPYCCICFYNFRVSQNI